MIRFAVTAFLFVTAFGNPASVVRSSDQKEDEIPSNVPALMSFFEQRSPDTDESTHYDLPIWMTEAQVNEVREMEKAMMTAVKINNRISEFFSELPSDASRMWADRYAKCVDAVKEQCNLSPSEFRLLENRDAITVELPTDMAQLIDCEIINDQQIQAQPFQEECDKLWKLQRNVAGEWQFENKTKAEVMMEILLYRNLTLFMKKSSSIMREATEFAIQRGKEMLDAKANGRNADEILEKTNEDSKLILERLNELRGKMNKTIEESKEAAQRDEEKLPVTTAEIKVYKETMIQFHSVAFGFLGEQLMQPFLITAGIRQPLLQAEMFQKNLTDSSTQAAENSGSVSEKEDNLGDLSTGNIPHVNNKSSTGSERSFAALVKVQLFQLH